MHNLQISPRAQQTLERLQAFFDAHIYPNESLYHQQLSEASDPWSTVPLMQTLKAKAKAAGLWNLFVPPSLAKFIDHDGFSNLDYAPMAELMGRVMWSSEVFNCNAPDTGNMEVLMKFGDDAQRAQWLTPLLEGEIRSAFAMTEPQVASSDATNVQLRIERDGDGWRLNGRKWFISGAMYERCKIYIVMGKNDPDNPQRHLQQSQILVPSNTPGIEVVRPMSAFGYVDPPFGHAEVVFKDVWVPDDHMILGAGRGFEIAQGRLGPGRMHHCMRLIGAAQRALELTCQRVNSRAVFGQSMSKNQGVRESIARSFADLEMARLMVCRAAQAMDSQGVKASIDLISATKARVPSMMQEVIDRCMQLHGAGGFSGDFPMAEAFSYARWCRMADGPDEVHLMSLGKQIIQRFGA
ncbi:MAG TPA: acyl-CoA dehydrogenase family protein [Pseudomonadales bacterium]|nr:acyl-CoA dehydrogenase family protein [Pseudomonadales bacterium]